MPMPIKFSRDFLTHEITWTFKSEKDVDEFLALLIKELNLKEGTLTCGKERSMERHNN